MADWGPGFNKVHVGKVCGVQTSTDRFGPRALKQINRALREVPDEWFTELALSDSSDEDDIVEQDGEADQAEVEAEDSDGYEQALTFWGSTGPDDDMSDADSVSSAENARRRRIPQVARLRMNLTALSRCYDLYFVAYEGEIHVFQPAQALQILQRPLLILKPKPTATAPRVGGYISPTQHHQINHLIVGELGDHEVLLFAYDDGDVAAYYTFAIAKYISGRRKRTRRIVPKPFLHETVGISAWGLAIHKKSRLIAVSSNLHEVTVFAFALAEKEHGSAIPWMNIHYPEEEEEAEKGSPASVADPGVWKAHQLEVQLGIRDRNWRILLPLGSGGNNVPCISFMDRPDGEAAKVVACDIRGICWILDIWNVGSVTLKIPSCRVSTGTNQRMHHTGWGVIALPVSNFLPTKYGTHCLGADPGACPFILSSPIAYVDTTLSLLNVEDNAGHEKIFKIHGRSREASTNVSAPTHFQDPTPRIREETELPDYDSSRDPMEVLLGETQQRRWKAVNERHVNERGFHRARVDVEAEARQNFRNDMIAVPTLGSYYCYESPAKLLEIIGSADKRKSQINAVQCGVNMHGSTLEDALAKRYAMLRTYDEDIELTNLVPNAPSVYCRDALVQVNYHQAPPLWDDQFLMRLHMLLHVPELNLVVAGSMCGRVALLRLTRAPDGKAPQHGFRVEWILPRDSDERARLRPYVALHGVAIGRAREPGARGLGLERPADGDAARGGRRRPPGVVAPRRWRLMLYYIDHTVLQYTIQETEPGVEDVLMVL